MRAVVINEPGSVDVMKLQDINKPRASGSDVLVKVHACGICHHDLLVRDGTLKRGISMPLILGHEVSGEVVEVGESVQKIKVGDRVAGSWYHVCGRCRYCRFGMEQFCSEAELLGDRNLNGGYADYVLIGEETVACVPDNVSFEEAAVATCALGTALHAVKYVGEVKVGDTVLVTGASGGVGIHALQLAKIAGAYVIAHTTSEVKREKLLAYGADVVIRTDPGEDFSPDVRKATCGSGVDVVIDNVGTPVFKSVLRCLHPGGKWVMVGQVTGEFVGFNPAQLFLRGINMLSVMGTTRYQLEEALRLVSNKTVTPVIDSVFPLDKVHDAHHKLESTNVIGRILLLI